MRDYVRLVPHAFRRFSVLAARRTLLPTLRYYAARPALSASPKPALFTMNILPPMMTVWHHCVRKHLGDRVDVVIFDCSGTLRAQDFPGARVQKFLNLYAATKTDEFLYRIARRRKIGWMCDDDVFFVSPRAVDLVEREMAAPGTASVSFRPRGWWHFAIDGQSHPVSASYCTAINRDIYCDEERLSLAPGNGNTHPSDIGKPPLRYDTFDRANEILLRKGYRCVVLPRAEEERCITGFSGMSGGVMLLNYFRTPMETLDFFRAPPEKKWKGSMLYGLLAALLAIRTVQECAETLTGRRYPLPSLPSRGELESLRREKEPLLANRQSFGWVDEAGERLKAAL